MSMSNNTDDVAADEVCANCGKSAVDDVKLKRCGCELVKYCNVDCQRNHRPKHKKACKKQIAKIREDRLFSQPDESSYGECPICCLPNSLDESKSSMMTCCSKLICNGCRYANTLREKEGRLEHNCLFCREELPKTQEKIDQNTMKRAKSNDPVALFEVGVKCHREGDDEGSFEYWTKAAGLGNIEAHYNLSVMYYQGQGVEKDTKKEVYHLEEASIGGNAKARFNLGNHEARNGREDRAVKHYIIAAKQGDDKSLKNVQKGFRGGLVSKEDFEAALRGHQAAVDATKSKQREEANAFYNLSPEEQQKRWVQFSRH